MVERFEADLNVMSADDASYKVCLSDRYLSSRVRIEPSGTADGTIMTCAWDDLWDSDAVKSHIS